MNPESMLCKNSHWDEFGSRRCWHGQCVSCYIYTLVLTVCGRQGCNVPDVDLVVQWKLPKSLSQFVQRAGRAARRRGRKGLAVLLVGPAVYATNLTGSAGSVGVLADRDGMRQSAKSGRGRGRGRPSRGRTTQASSTPRTAKDRRKHAVAHGVNRGGHKSSIHFPSLWPQCLLMLKRRTRD